MHIVVIITAFPCIFSELHRFSPVAFSPRAFFLRCYPVPLLRGKPCKAVADDAQKNPGIMAGICELSHYLLIPKRNISVGNKGCIITSSLKMNNLGDKAVTS